MKYREAGEFSGRNTLLATEADYPAPSSEPVTVSVLFSDWWREAGSNRRPTGYENANN
jgi:hypothetical protein